MKSSVIGIILIRSVKKLNLYLPLLRVYVVSLDSENASDELPHIASRMRKKLDMAADDEAYSRLSRNEFILLDRYVEIKSLIKSIDTSNIPRTDVSTIRIGIADMKKKYAICAAKPA